MKLPEKPTSNTGAERILGVPPAPMTEAGKRSLWVIVGAAFFSMLIVVILKLGGA